MASIIRIKRSSVAGNPNVLAAGELAYSGLPDNGSNGGDRLYIGMGTETNNNAVNHVVIGGKYFTDMLDHTPGVLTASSALVVDSNKKLNELLVDNIKLDGNTISTTDPSGVLNLSGNAVISGNLTVQGTTTSVNSTTVSIGDLNITLAKDASEASEANGAGITVAGAGATFTYTSTNDRWNLNKDLVVANVYGNLIGSIAVVDGGTY